MRAGPGTTGRVLPTPAVRRAPGCRCRPRGGPGPGPEDKAGPAGATHRRPACERQAATHWLRKDAQDRRQHTGEHPPPPRPRAEPVHSATQHWRRDHLAKVAGRGGAEPPVRHVLQPRDVQRDCREGLPQALARLLQYRARAPEHDGQQVPLEGDKVCRAAQHLGDALGRSEDVEAGLRQPVGAGLWLVRRGGHPPCHPGPGRRPLPQRQRYGGGRPVHRAVGPRPGLRVPHRQVRRGARAAWAEARPQPG
mmetsp:Transcript_77785/g.231677  ORF Transcript_77785/g.231677 Transcript_77785/m.231677 type:complete len:251 (-) Transcript_77785:414-1166(-)